MSVHRIIIDHDESGSSPMWTPRYLRRRPTSDDRVTITRPVRTGADASTDLELVLHNTLVGSDPGDGKSNLLNLIAAYAALDPGR